MLIKQMMKKDVQSESWEVDLELIWSKISSESVQKVFIQKAKFTVSHQKDIKPISYIYMKVKEKKNRLKKLD